MHKPDFSAIEGRWVPQMSTLYEGWESSGFGIGENEGIVTIGRNHVLWSQCPDLPIPILDRRCAARGERRYRCDRLSRSRTRRERWTRRDHDNANRQPGSDTHRNGPDRAGRRNRREGPPARPPVGGKRPQSPFASADARGIHAGPTPAAQLALAAPASASRDHAMVFTYYNSALNSCYYHLDHRSYLL